MAPLVKSRRCHSQDFVSAVMSVDYSPTGREFVAGGYDRSVRIFSYNGGHSREVYHTKRMQRVMAVQFSADASYVFSGSDDMNLRIWKVGHCLQLPLMLLSHNPASSSSNRTQQSSLARVLPAAPALRKSVFMHGCCCCERVPRLQTPGLPV